MEGVQVLGAPGAEDGSQRHLALGAMHRAGTAADLAADYQGPQAPFGRVVVRWRVRLSHEDKQFLDKAFDASAEFALNCHWVFQAYTNGYNLILTRKAVEYDGVEDISHLLS